MDLQDQVDIGKRAEDFLRYLDDNPYFYDLINRVKLQYSANILSLNSSEKDKFAINIERMDVWSNEIIDAVRGDIQVAIHALKIMEGEPEKGLL